MSGAGALRPLSPEYHEADPVAFLVGIDQEREDRTLDCGHPLLRTHAAACIDYEKNRVSHFALPDFLAQV